MKNKSSSSHHKGYVDYAKASQGNDDWARLKPYRNTHMRRFKKMSIAAGRASPTRALVRAL
jgi:hypothetical protein